ncbi:flagellar basal body P-ring formation protein FlgA [bacterium]|nr:flagellar basal body P-ring formation protein FlgA [bacterium]MBR1775849.1 flagellar basal body P-ring formation protein FlgA [bacterium]
MNRSYLTENKISKIRIKIAGCFIAALLLFAVPTVQAQVLTSNQVKTDVARLFENNYKKTISGDVEVKITGTQFAELQLPDGKITYKIVSGGDRIMPRDIKRVDVYVNGVFIRTLNLPAQTVVMKEVLVASDFINREQTLTKECTQVKKIDVSMKMNYVLEESMLEKEITTKKTFQKGEIIDKRFVKMRPDVARNSDVRVFFISNGAVMISIDGTAIQDGMIGDYVNVENKNYKRVYNGKVIGENKVLVNI